MKSMFRTLLPALLVVVFSVGVVRGQNPNAAVSGTVTDATGAVVPDTAVALTNNATGVVFRATTNSGGVYRVSELPPGTYQAKLTHEGFKAFIKEQIELHVQSAVTLDATLQTGAVTESVNVESAAAVLETQSSTTGQVIEGRQVNDMPLNGRNIMNLVALVTGVQPHEATGGSAAGNQGGAPSYTNPAGWANYSIGGAVAGWNAQFLDGAPLNVSGNNWNSLVPTQDSVAEFKVETNAISAQFGRFGGGVINFVTKSGTNQFHGTLYEYLRNARLNSNDFFSNQIGSPRNNLKQNQYGGTLGGPIRKDKTFFFYSYEELRVAEKSRTRWTLPTVAEKSGDFRADPPIVDPQTGQQFQCNGVLNVICPNRINPVAAYMTTGGANGKGKYFYDPNIPLTNGQNYVAAGEQAITAPQQAVRLDHYLSEKQQIFGRYNHWSSQGVPTYYDSPTQYFPYSVNSTNNLVLGDTYTFTPSFVANFRLSYNRFRYDVLPPDAGTADLTPYGPSWSAVGNAMTIKSYPTVLGTQNMGFTLSQAISGYHNVYGISGNLTKIANKHSITFGGEVRRIEWYYRTANPDGGQLLFTGAFTHNPISDFLLGMNTPASSFGIPIAAPSEAYNYYQGLFVNDSFKATRRFTLNYGVRWELPGAWREKKDKDTVLLPYAPNPLGTIVNPVTGSTQALTGLLALVNSTSYPSRNETALHLHLFDPRIGLAYSINDKTVVRAGFGLVNPSLDSGSQAGPGMSPVTQAFTQATGDLSSPFPNGLLLPSGHNPNIMAPASQYAGTLEGATFTAEYPYQSYPYFLQWNANVGRTLGRNTSFELGYMASRGVHLAVGNVDINQLPERYYSQGAALLNTVPSNPFAALVGKSSAILSSNSVAGQFLRPYPQFLNVYIAGERVGFSKYDALQASFRTRLSSGGMLLVSYTFARTLTDVDTVPSLVTNGANVGGIQNFNNLSAEKSPSYFDYPNRFVASYIVDLPFGKGKRYLANFGGVGNVFVSGWAVNGIATIQSGQALSFFVSGNNALTNTFGAGAIRPNVISGCQLATSGSAVDRLNNWFNTACLTRPGNFAFGNAPRVDTAVRADGLKNLDFTIVKSTPINERIRTEFRAEAFNVLNHPQFGTPGTTLGGNSFGNIFGQVTAQENQPRIVQLSLRLRF